MNRSILSTSTDVRKLIDWLHRDIDDSLVDCEAEVMDNYASMFAVLECYGMMLRNVEAEQESVVPLQ